MQGLFKSHAALFIVQLMYGANYVIAKGLMPNVVGPNGFILIRGIGAVILFWTILSFRWEKVDRKDFGRLALSGLFGVACNQLMFFNGLMLTSPLNAPVIMTTTPIIVLVLSAIFLRERIRLIQLIGVVIGAFSSVFFILLNAEDTFASGRGDVFIFLNAFSYALYLITVKPLMKKYKPITVITWVFTFGIIYVMIWFPSIQEFNAVEWSSLSMRSIWQILFVVIGVTFLTYLLNVYALKRLSPSITAVYIYLQPIIAGVFVYISFMVGDADYTKDMNPLKAVFAVLVFVGVYLVIKPDKKKKVESQ